MDVERDDISYGKYPRRRDKKLETRLNMGDNLVSGVTHMTFDWLETSAWTCAHDTCHLMPFFRRSLDGGHKTMVGRKDWTGRTSMWIIVKMNIETAA